MKKGIDFLAVVLTCAILSGIAHGEDYVCYGYAGSMMVDNLIVPQGVACTLYGTFVKGSIKVEKNAALSASRIYVIGNIQAENAAQVDVLSGSDVGGNIQIKQGGGAVIDGVRIKGDLQFEKNRSGLTVNRNTIGGNLQAFKNSGCLSITQNAIDANLQCKENWPAPTGGGNIVRGNREDQCANF